MADDTYNLDTELVRLRTLKLKATALKAEAASVYNEMKSVEARAFAYMQERPDDEKINGHKVGPINYVPTTTIRTKITDEEAFLAWADTQDETLHEVKIKPREAVLNQLVRTAVDNGEPPPPGLEIRLQEYISTKAS